MTAWYGEQSLKDAAMRQLREHRRMDQIAQREYFMNGKGCHLGCLTHDNENSHSSMERMFGIELRIAYWLETVFEHLQKEECAEWVIESTSAIPVGADLSRCHHQLAVWLLGPDSPSAAGNADKTVSRSISDVRALHARAIAGGIVTSVEWSAAGSAARSAARSAAESAARSAARSAADSAAWTADSAAWTADFAAGSARYAVRSAEWSVAHAAYERSAGWSAVMTAAMNAAMNAAGFAAWRDIATKSIEIFRSAPVVAGPTCSAECMDSVSRTIAAIESPSAHFQGAPGGDRPR